MACVDALVIQNLRVLRLLSIDNTADFNLVTGDNGSGKTTLLEAIFLAGQGRSFRTQQARQFIRRDCSEASIRARIGERIIKLKHNSRKLVISVDGKAVSRRQLVGLVPVKKFVPQDHLFIEGGSVLRRQYLDWGCFHLESEYRDLWMRFVRVWRQRNAELKKPSGHLDYWDKLFCRLAGQLHEFRNTYWQEIKDRIQGYLDTALNLDACECVYYPGWAKESSLPEELLRQRKRDLYRGYTSVGPHRADIHLRVADKAASQQLSRGQQKLWNLSMNLAQVEHHHLMTGQRCVWLIDDLASELDSDSFGRVIRMFRAKHSQYWFTAFEEHQSFFIDSLQENGSLAKTRLV